MHNEFAKCEIKTSVFSGRKSRTGNYCHFSSLVSPEPRGRPTFGTVRSRQRRTGSEIISFREWRIIHGDSNRRTTKRSPHHGTRPVRKQDRDFRTGATGGPGRRRLLGPPSVRDAIASLSARIPGLLALRTTECAHVG